MCYKRQDYLNKVKEQILKDPVEHNKILYAKQRTWCVQLLRKEKKEYFTFEKDIVDNKKFWQTIKPFSFRKIKVKRENNFSGKGRINFK